MNAPKFELGQEVWVINKKTQKLPNIKCPVCLGSGFLRNANEEKFKCRYCDGTGEKECHSVAHWVAEKDMVYCVVHCRKVQQPTYIYNLLDSPKLYAESESIVHDMLDLFQEFYESDCGIWQNVNCQNVAQVSNIFATEAEALAKCVELNGAIK